MQCFWAVVFGFGVWVLLGGGAWAQQNELTLEVEPGFAGLDGVMRPGSWAGIRVSVDNAAADDRDVWVSWEHADADGDRVVARRRVTLTRQREDQSVWLYAAVPMATDPDTRWDLRAVDAESGELLATLAVSPNAETLLTDDETLVAVTSTADLGLNDYARHETSHRPVRLVRGLSLSRMPDRWQGLDALSGFVWTQDLGGDPADPLEVSEQAAAALRAWVARGGHLVVVLPEVGETWTGSPLADLLPVSARQLRRHNTDRWWAFEWIGGRRPAPPPRPDGSGPAFSRGGADQTMAVTTFDIEQDASGTSAATVLLRDEEGRAVAVAGRYGFGRVTVVGLDLTSSVVRRNALYLSQRRLWNHVFNWRFPVLAEAVAEGEVRNNRMIPAHRLNTNVDLIDFVPGRIAMTGTVSALLVGAVLLFGVYWLFAGWLLQPALKQKGRERFAWVGFVALVLAFAGVAWGGAALLRPGRTGVQHVTVLDYDGNANVARGRAYLSLFVPRFGAVEVATASGEEEGILPRAGGIPGAIASPGLEARGGEAGFVDTQRYTVDAASPDAVALPMRATSKTLRLDYVGPVDRDVPGLLEPFSIGVAEPIVAGRDGGPVGEVLHTLPGELTNVRVIFCPGEAFDTRGQRRQLEPQIWRPLTAGGDTRGPPGEPVGLAGRPADREPLLGRFRTWAQVPADREWKVEGFLGRRIGEQKSPGLGEVPIAVDESVIVRQFELMSFFGALPPPDVKRDPAVTDLFSASTFSRRLGAGL
ncbi:MAG: hypothetical protein AAFX76_08375, partial [Planctomycetota bacterium]